MSHATRQQSTVKNKTEQQLRQLTTRWRLCTQQTCDWRVSAVTRWQSHTLLTQHITVTMHDTSSQFSTCKNLIAVTKQVKIILTYFKKGWQSLEDHRPIGKPKKTWQEQVDFKVCVWASLMLCTIRIKKISKRQTGDSGWQTGWWWQWVADRLVVTVGCRQVSGDSGSQTGWWWQWATRILTNLVPTQLGYTTLDVPEKGL